MNAYSNRLVNSYQSTRHPISEDLKLNQQSMVAKIPSSSFTSTTNVQYGLSSWCGHCCL